MGFYGNITNTSNTTFSFDRIYPNRLAMDANANNDGIFIGRYVLVEYDNKATISNIFVDTQHPAKTIDGEKYYYAYTTDNFTDINTRIQYKPNNRGENKNINVYFLGEFGQVQKVEGNQLQQEYYTEFYQCVDSIISEKDSTIFYALFKYVTKSTKSDSEYIKNFAIDEAQYKEKKGYDSTVWTKASIKKENGLLVTEYVRIADLNSVVPTFDLETDAPTMKPLVPHFDADSTNVYYKLHTQPQWGLRVAEVESGKISDSKTNWISSTYNPETGQLIPSEDNGEHDAAIYFNKAAFLSQVDINRKTTDGINKKKEDNQEKNYFTINPTGTSGNQYYLHTTLDQNGNLQKVYGPAVDIQEMEINLPAIGNMMSDAWDIIYGPKRDKARTDEDGSLQGRLDSFKAIEDNHIPIKRNDDGTIIGTAINGNNNYQMPNGKNILTTTHFPLTTNDPWINVTIDNSSLQGGYDKDNKIEISQEKNNAIHIRHSANSVDSTTTSWDKNDAENYTNNSYSYYEIDTNINGNQDEIKLYTPYVDATGHVVGKNIETVTLPYGYKSITIANDGDKVNAAPGNMTGTQIANNTQADIKFNTSNKWVVLDKTNEDDVVKFGHLLTSISTQANSDYGLSKNMSVVEVDNNDNKFNVPVFQFDKAGHVTKAETHTVSLPNGFTAYSSTTSSINNQDSINGISGSIEPDSMTDTIVFAEGNQWINITAVPDDNKFIFSHYVKDFNKANNVEIDFNNSTTNTITSTNWQKDKAGHLISGQDTVYTLPNAIKTLTIANSGVNLTGNTTATSGNLVADKLVDAMTIDTGNRWIVLSTDITNDKVSFYHAAPDSNSTSVNTTNANDNKTKTLNFNSEFEIPQVKYDETGHIFGVSKHTITLDSTENLQLNNYSKGNNSSPISSDEKLNSAFGKLENRLDTLQASATTVGSVANTVATEIAKIVNENANGSIDTLNEIANWIVNDTSGAAKMVNDIATLKDNDTVSGSVANSIKIAIEGLDSSKTADTNNYISGITITDGKITNIQQTALGSAAYKNEEYFAKAEQGSKADTAIQLDTEITYKIQKDDGEGNITEEELKTTIQEMAKEIATLKQILKDNGLITE